MVTKLKNELEEKQKIQQPNEDKTLAQLKQEELHELKYQQQQQEIDDLNEIVKSLSNDYDELQNAFIKQNEKLSKNNHSYINKGEEEKSKQKNKKELSDLVEQLKKENDKVKKFEIAQ
eukprot:Pgem_evm1s1626